MERVEKQGSWAMSDLSPDLSPQEIEFLILGYEELDPDERAVADIYLRRHPELVARLQWHQQKEGQAVKELPVEDLFGQDMVLQSADEEAQQESLRRILAGLDLGDDTADEAGPPRVAAVSFTSRFRRQAQWVLPLAAVLAVLVLMPRGADKSLLLKDLVVVRIELAADGNRGADQPIRGDGALHSGQAFALDFTLKEEAFVVIYHIDPAGQVARVYPESPIGVSPHSGGQEHQVPSPDSGETWILGRETGTESFLVASGQELLPDLDGMRVTAGTTDRALIVADIMARLAEIMDQVDLYEFEHLD
jgi:hypothetical protein